MMPTLWNISYGSDSCIRMATNKHYVYLSSHYRHLLSTANKVNCRAERLFWLFDTVSVNKPGGSAAATFMTLAGKKPWLQG